MQQITVYQNTVLIFIIIGSIVYFIVTRYLIEYKKAIQEKRACESFQEGIGLKDINNAFAKPAREIGDKLNSAFDKIGNTMKDPFAKIGDIFDKIKQAFEDIPKRFNRIGDGFKDIFEGIGLEVEGTIRGVSRGFNDIGVLLNYVFELVRTYLFCGVKFIQNLHKCIIYYIIDSIFSIMYLPISFSLWFIKMFTGRDLYGLEKQAWDIIYLINDYIYGAVGFNIVKWPRNIRNLCYNCKRLKISALDNKASEVNIDFTTRIADDLIAGKKRIGEGGANFMRAFGNNP